MSNKNIVAEAKALVAQGFTTEQVAAMLSVTPIKKDIVNTTTSVRQNASTLDITRAIAQAAHRFKNEELKEVIIEPPYGKMTGGVIKVSINGVGLALPANGKGYKVPMSFYLEFKERMRNLNIMDSKAGPQIESDNTSRLFKMSGLAPDRVDIKHD